MMKDTALQSRSDRCTEPPSLGSTEQSEVESFFENLSTYNKAGGSKKMIEFIDPSFLEHILEMELSEDASDSEIERFLRNESRPDDVRSINELIESEVEIDTAKTCGKTRLESLFLSLGKALKKLGLKEVATSEDDFIYTFKQQKILIMKKLPIEFKEAFEMWQKYKEEVVTRPLLYKQMQLVEKEMSPYWPDCRGSKKSVTKYEKELQKFAEEHVEETKQSRAKGHRTRSKDD